MFNPDPRISPSDKQRLAQLPLGQAAAGGGWGWVCACSPRKVPVFLTKRVLSLSDLKSRSSGPAPSCPPIGRVRAGQPMGRRLRALLPPSRAPPPAPVQLPLLASKV